MEKKSAKWQCKLCGERQSLKQVFNFSRVRVIFSPWMPVQVFARGSGSECRKAVQELNLKRMEVGRLEEQKLETAIMEEENKERNRFSEYEEEENHRVTQGNLEPVQEGAELIGLSGRPPLAPLQASTSGSRWGKFLPSSTPEWEEEDDDLEEEIQGCDLLGKSRVLRSWGEDEVGHENLEDEIEHHGVPSKRSKSHVGKRKAIDPHAGNSFSSTGNVSSKWRKFSN